MNKKIFMLSIVILSLAAIAIGQGGPYSLSIGSGAGNLAFTKVYSWGHIDGDDGTFYYDATNNGTTVWNGCFMLTNVDNTAQTYWMDKDFTNHTVHPTDGTINTTASGLTNNGMTFASTAGLTANLTVSLTQPSPNTQNIAKMTWEWAFSNSTASALNLRMIFFLDGDMYFPGTNYNDELVAAIASDYGAYKTVCQGKNNGTGQVDLNRGIKIDCSDTISRFFGLSNNSGPSYFWSNTAPYNPKGPEVVFKIDDSYANTIENDATNDKLSDSGRDSGMAIQCDFTVGASSSKTVTFYATWGLDQIATKVANWNLY